MRQLTKVWKTKLQQNETHESIMTETINFLKGIFQGDSLLVILFILSINPFSHLLKQLKGYAAGSERSVSITHNFFADDLKLYARTTNNLKMLVDIVTVFSKDIHMKSEIDKCAYIKINGGKQTNSKVPFEMNNLIIQPVAKCGTYKYLGQDENTAYVGEVNKKRVRKN